MGRKMWTRGAVYLALGIMSFCLATSGWAETGLDGRRQVVLEGASARLSVDVAGGSIVDFHLAKQGLNPFTWNYPEKGDTKPRTMGHFVCFDRWGQPSPQEVKNGMPFHGEAAQVVWKVLSEPAKRNGVITAEMSCELPIGGLSLKRTLRLADNSAFLSVREEITNTGKLGRVYNIVQHPSIGPGFLDPTVVVDTNAWKGFKQGGTMPFPEEPVIYWPRIVHNGELVDLRTLTVSHEPGVTSFVFADSVRTGWVTALNPGKRLLVGYFWDVSEYPWLNIWRNVKDGNPVARGMEFGTTGLHQPFTALVAKREIFGAPLYEYIDAGQTIVKSYTLFLAETPESFDGVGEISMKNGTIVIRERGERGRTITVEGR